MKHAIYHVTSVQAAGPYILRVGFNDGTVQVIDFRPVLEGEIYGPLKDLKLFNEVSIDPEVRTIVWSSGADFDPAILHDWPQHADAFRRRAQEWACQPV
jgi:hypothetical protein